MGSERNAPQDEAPRITWPMLAAAIHSPEITDHDLGAMLRLWAEQGQVTWG